MYVLPVYYFNRQLVRVILMHLTENFEKIDISFNLLFFYVIPFQSSKQHCHRDEMSHVLFFHIIML